MKHLLPPIEDIRAVLKQRTPAELSEIAKRAGFSYNTLIKVRSGKTESPNYEMMRAVLPHIELRLETVTRVVSHG